MDGEENEKGFGAQLGNLIERVFNRHKFVRRAVIFWSMGLITYIVLNHPDMNSTNFMGVIGLMATAIGLYQWDKALDKKTDGN